MRPAYRRYTPEDDAEILAALAPGEIQMLAAKLGRSVSALHVHRSLLRSGDAGGLQPHRSYNQPARTPRGPLPSRFARPDFFDEDVGALSRKTR